MRAFSLALAASLFATAAPASVTIDWPHLTWPEKPQPEQPCPTPAEVTAPAC